jgi:serine protease
MRSKIARLFVCSIICLVLAPTGVSQVIRSDDPVPGEYIVTFEPDATDPAGLANDISRAAGVTPRFVYKHAIKGFSFHGSEARAVALSKHPSVGFVFEATKMYPGGSGTQFSPPWGLDRIDARTGIDGMFSYGYSVPAWSRT